MNFVNGASNGTIILRRHRFFVRGGHDLTGSCAFLLLMADDSCRPWVYVARSQSAMSMMCIPSCMYASCRVLAIMYLG